MPTQRASYGELKTWFLSTYFDLCRSRGFHRKWSFEKMILHVHDDFIQTYTSPVEILMADVIGLTLTGGWFTELEDYYRNRIDETLSGGDLDGLLDGLPGPEAEELLRDLNALKIANPAKVQ